MTSRDNRNAYKRGWRKRNKSRLAEQDKVYRASDKRRKWLREYKEKNKEQLKIKNREYQKRKRNNDPFYKLKSTLRVRMNDAFRHSGYKKGRKTELLLGAAFKTVKKHLERQFLVGMTWDNHGEWHIDHKIPIASAKTEMELMRLFHFTNLQPLWKADNLKKSKKLNKTMNNKIILTKDMALTLAQLAVAIKSETANHVLVLAEIMRLSEDGMVLYPKSLSPAICKKLNMTESNYRRCIAKLTDMKLIVRDQSAVFLTPLVKTPFSTVTIKEKISVTNL